MAKVTYFFFAVAILALAMAGCKEKEETVIAPAASAVTAAPAAPAAVAAQGDLDFYTQATSGGLAEVEASRAISEKTANSTVREFAQTMAEDHSAANEELRRIAQIKQLDLPATPLSAPHQEMLAQLSSAMGAESDRVYAQEFGVKAHQEAIVLFDKQSREGTDPEFKAFAAATLPKLKTHLEHAQQLADNLPK